MSNLTVTINDIGKRLAGIYGQTTGDTILCSLPAPVHEFSEEENEMLGTDDEDMVSLMFNRNGKFKYVGFHGEWYGLITMPKSGDIDIVLSMDNLSSLDLIDEVGKTSDYHWLATLSM